jgi:hypothetical protein
LPLNQTEICENAKDEIYEYPHTKMQANDGNRIILQVCDDLYSAFGIATISKVSRLLSSISQLQMKASSPYEGHYSLIAGDIRWSRSPRCHGDIAESEIFLSFSF